MRALLVLALCAGWVEGTLLRGRNPVRSLVLVRAQQRKGQQQEQHLKSQSRRGGGEGEGQHTKYDVLGGVSITDTSGALNNIMLNLANSYSQVYTSLQTIHQECKGQRLAAVARRSAHYQTALSLEDAKLQQIPVLSELEVQLQSLLTQEEDVQGSLTSSEMQRDSDTQAYLEEHKDALAQQSLLVNVIQALRERRVLMEPSTSVAPSGYTVPATSFAVPHLDYIIGVFVSMLNTVNGADLDRANEWKSTDAAMVKVSDSHRASLLHVESEHQSQSAEAQQARASIAKAEEEAALHRRLRELENWQVTKLRQLCGWKQSRVRDAATAGQEALDALQTQVNAATQSMADVATYTTTTTTTQPLNQSSSNLVTLLNTSTFINATASRKDSALPHEGVARPQVRHGSLPLSLLQRAQFSATPTPPHRSPALEEQQRLQGRRGGDGLLTSLSSLQQKLVSLNKLQKILPQEDLQQVAALLGDTSHVKAAASADPEAAFAQEVRDLTQQKESLTSQIISARRAARTARDEVAASAARIAALAEEIALITEEQQLWNTTKSVLVSEWGAMQDLGTTFDQAVATAINAMAAVEEDISIYVAQGLTDGMVPPTITNLVALISSIQTHLTTLRTTVNDGIASAQQLNANLQARYVTAGATLNTEVSTRQTETTSQETARSTAESTVQSQEAAAAKLLAERTVVEAHFDSLTSNLTQTNTAFQSRVEAALGDFGAARK